MTSGIEWGALREQAAEPGVPVIIEIPKGSRNKYEFDHVTGRIKLDRMLFSAVQYPTDYGFIPDTLAEDGDPLDAMVLLGEPTFSGCLIETRIVGLLRMTDDKGPDEKLLTVPLYDPQWNHIHRLSDVPEQWRREIHHFFAIYKELEGRPVTVEGWEPSENGVKALELCRARYAEHGAGQEHSPS
jgi:inorganic pyrophosphatase